MRRLLPHPLVSLWLLALWLLLQQSLSVGNILLGILIAVGAGLGTGALGLKAPHWRKQWLLPVLLGRVLVDVFRSNLAVAWIVISEGRAPSRAGFLKVPLALKDPTALAFLSIILTATPGTVWLEHDPDEGTLLLHVLDLVDEATWIDIVKNRYESLLLEMLS